MATQSSTTPSKDGSNPSSSTWMGWNDQLDAYMQWINSQLKKKPGTRLVEDLRNDTRDGVAFIDLLSVIAGEDIAGVHDVPSTYAEMKENVERILHFMAAKKIRMHHIMAKDIVDGNLKSIMRLILALAAHYKPNSVKHSSSSSRGSTKSDRRSPNVSAIAQYRKRHYNNESSSDQYSDSDTSFHADHPRYVPGRERGDVDGASAGSSPTSHVHSPPTLMASSTSSVGADTPLTTLSVMSSVSKSRSADYISCKDSGTELEDSVFTPARGPTVQKAQYDDLLSEYLKLADAMATIKKDLSQLQDLLLSGQPPDGAESRSREYVEGTTPEEQIVILQSQLQQSKDVCQELREDLSKNKLELMKSGLQQRITDQETTISQLKSELLRRDFQKQNFDSEQINISKQIQDKDKMISDLRKDITRRDQRIDHLQHEIQMQIADKESVTKSLKLQVKELGDRFRVVDETGTGADELGVLRESLGSLRQCFSPADPHQHTLDTIEQGISTLLERLPSSHNSSSREITLHDFKGAFDRPGQYRYHFKALDPEFGTVKEEISNEETIIPGWEGKIVAWIEPDTGQ
ncbi:DIXC1-like protein [Mya arenaria]|uniref:DIXC1-like protein n=1 Tax=Mya arenaria TaxID=6604 RepID=A0ABY7E6U9_MYAAR|nr:DIXC1-like protein [Mya arenaria]